MQFLYEKILTDKSLHSHYNRYTLNFQLTKTASLAMKLIRPIFSYMSVYLL